MPAEHSRVQAVVTFAATYFAIVFGAGFVLGAIRTLLIVPRTGELPAVLLELPIILTISWFACGYTLRRFPIPRDAAAHAAAGALAFLFLLLAELLLTTTAFDGTPTTFITHLATPPGAIGVAGQLVFALFPFLRRPTPDNEPPMKDLFDQRYRADEYAYGEEPNAFFKARLDELPAPGRILLPAEGEGRNAVYAARKGWKVDAFDFSEAGREKALRLAERHGVHINYEVADYETAHIEPEAYDAIALIFAHIHEDTRQQIHQELVPALKPGGHLFLEAYSPEQLDYGTGGPPTPEMLYSLETLRADFSALTIIELEKLETEIHEGRYHTGLASVVRLVAKR